MSRCESSRSNFSRALVKADHEITLTGDAWELPFAFGEPINFDIEFEGDGEPELEIEVELSGRIEDDVPDVA